MKELVFGGLRFRKQPSSGLWQWYEENGKWWTIQNRTEPEMLNEIERLRQIEEKYEQIKGEVR